MISESWFAIDSDDSPLRNRKITTVMLTGFLNADGQARGRPVGIAFGHGGVLVADDVGNVIWRIHSVTLAPP